MKKTLLLSIAVFVFFATAVSSAANPQVVMETNYGDITLELYPEEAPVTVNNFLSYVNSDFYDGLIFHRVIENFVIQGGGYYYNGDDGKFYLSPTLDPIINESDNGLSNLRGTLGMARTSEPDSATSQFYFNLIDNLHLDQPNAYDGVGHCVFGAVIEGMDVFDAIAQIPTFPYQQTDPYFYSEALPQSYVGIIDVYVVPEPATLLLLGMGGLLMRKR